MIPLLEWTARISQKICIFMDETTYDDLVRGFADLINTGRVFLIDTDFIY